MSRDKECKTEDWEGKDDGELVLAARDGRLGAFDALVGRYQRRVTARAYHLLNNVDDAMEVAQDAFLKAFEKLNTLSRPERFGHWVLRIVGNMALNRRRARALRKTASLDVTPAGGDEPMELNIADPAAATPEALVSAKDIEVLIWRVIQELPENQRVSLVLFSIEKFPQKQIAEILNCSVEAVKWNVFTARKTLKDKLKDYL